MKNLELGHKHPIAFLRNSTMECNTQCQRFARKKPGKSPKSKVRGLYVAAIFKLGSQYTSAKFEIGSKWVSTSLRAGCNYTERFLLCHERGRETRVKADTHVLLSGARILSHHTQAMVPLCSVDTQGSQRPDYRSRS